LKTPKTWNRREFDVTPNGYFTVLKSSGWFSAARLPAGFRYLAKGAPDPISRFPLHSEGQATGLPPQILASNSKEPYLKRLALALLGGVAVTWAILWCLFQA
jgi:hypothetical protein